MSEGKTCVYIRVCVNMWHRDCIFFTGTASGGSIKADECARAAYVEFHPGPDPHTPMLTQAFFIFSSRLSFPLFFYKITSLHINISYFMVQCDSQVQVIIFR